MNHDADITSRGYVRPAMWALLLISIPANIVFSVTNHILIQAVFGVLALGSATVLIVRRRAGGAHPPS